VKTLAAVVAICACVVAQPNTAQSSEPDARRVTPIQFSLAPAQLALAPGMPLSTPNGIAKRSEPEFAADLLRYKHERDGLSSFKSVLALTEASLAISVLATKRDSFTLGVAAVSSLRAVDFAYEFGTILARNLLLDKELNSREEIRKIRSGWQRFALFSALMNTAVGLAACIGWLTVKNDFVRGIFTGLTIQTAHSVAEELVDAFVMRPW
jgi:hypothetical protein